MTQITIYALGAYDRFNYGDMLFPIIAKNFLAQHYPQLGFQCYALQTSDFSAYGGFPTQPISKLSRPGILRDGDSILFCGGGTLGSDWYSMHANLLGKVGNHVIYYFRRVLGVATANDWSRRYFGSNSHFPWIADPQDFPARVKVLYNAVGGSELARFPDDERQLALNKLAQAAYLSFRDNETQRLCTTAAAHNRLHVAPDSAVLMSEQYPLARLRTLITPALTGQLANQRYVCFHANYNFVKQNLHTLTQLLEALYREHRLTTVLLPIGRYVGLDDQIGLRALQQQLETPCALISDQASIWDIMYTVASAQLFIGTSLHGNVTSQSFAVPHIGLSSRRSKLDYYLETWDLPEQQVCSDLQQVLAHAAQALAVADHVLQEKRKQLIELATHNMHRIGQVSSNPI